MTTIETTKDALGQARTRMEKAVEDFRKELATIRTGRANTGLLDSIRVDYHGTPMPVNQLGTLSVPDPTVIVISPWDPSAVALIDKAIRTSDLGLNPASDGKVIRVPIPALDRGAAQRSCEAYSQSARESPYGRTQYSPRCQRGCREVRERKKDQRR